MNLQSYVVQNWLEGFDRTGYQPRLFLWLPLITDRRLVGLSEYYRILIKNNLKFNSKGQEIAKDISYKKT